MLYTPYSTLTVNNVTSTGSTYGWQLGTQSTYFYDKSWGLSGYLGYQTLKPRISESQDNINFDIKGLSFSGVVLTVGLLYRI